MLEPKQPEDEKERLASLHSLNVLDTPPEERFDRITRLAQRLFGVPIVAVSLVDHARQWFKSIQGLDVRETGRDVSFCGHAILQNEVTVIEDAAKDGRFLDNPLVTDDPKIRFYAGHPLASADGRNLGTLCIIDRQPRSLSAADLLLLEDLSRMAENELNLVRASSAQTELMGQLEDAERRALQDSLTEMWNREGISQLLSRTLSLANASGATVGILSLDIDHFKRINDTHGHPAGDAVLREVSARVRSSLRSGDVVGRVGGEEFLVVVDDTDPRVAAQVAERIRRTVASAPVALPPGGGVESVPVRVSIGIAVGKPGTEQSVLLQAADLALYTAKEGGRNRVEGCPLPGEDLSAVSAQQA